MSTTTLDCPYQALGLTKDATLANIKSAYRKLVLTCHPDKVTDETLKAQKAEEFHKIQNAYDRIGDEESREKHDAEVKLAALRQEMGRDARSGYPTANSSAYRPTRNAAVFEERRPSFDTGYFEEPSRASARKTTEDYPASRRSPPRPRGTEQYSEKEREKAKRAERERVRDQEERRERDMKKSFYEQDAYEDDRRRRDRDADTSRSESYKSGRVDPESELDRKLQDAKAHIAGVRPSTHRTTSSQSPEIRRSRAAPRETVRSRRSGSVERVRERIVPILETHKSEPAKMDIPSARTRSPPRRSYTTQGDSELRRSSEDMPHPGLRRTETAPVSSYRRKEANPTQPSKLRTSTTVPHDSGYSSNSGPGSPEAAHGYTPEIPAAQPKSSSTRYRYPEDDKDSGKYKYEIRVPGHSPPRERVRESERPPLASYGAYVSPRTSRHTSYSSTGETRRPTMARHSSSSTSHVPRVSTRSPERSSRSERDRDYHYERDEYERPTTKYYYGEIPSSRSKDSASFTPEKISTRRTFRQEDVNTYKDWGTYGAKPGLERSQTYNVRA